MTVQAKEITEQDAAVIKNHEGIFDANIRLLIQWKNNEVTPPTKMTPSKIDESLADNLYGLADFELANEDGRLRVENGKVSKVKPTSALEIVNCFSDERLTERTRQLIKKYGLEL